MNTETRQIRRPEEFFSSPKPSTIFEEVRASLRSEPLIDPGALREAEAWSDLGGRIVGAEGRGVC